MTEVDLDLFDRVAARLATPPTDRPAKPSRTAKQKFRASLAWRRTRYAVLAENAARNGGTARCELCGAAGEPGKALHVDHIVAVSRDWSRRFDVTNLQVMCAACNVGKLDGPAADFRPAPSALVPPSPK